ncbi:MAG: hypothetical protein Q4B26_00485 [Eubacteriales bacterium]|nr:hypothetical protein [Eubacteriales bacterium]
MSYENKEVISPEKRKQLQRDIPILTAEIRAVYRELDRKLHLHGADVTLNFTYDPEQLGAYVRGNRDVPENFSFSLLFIGYHNEKQISKEDRQDLYRHEYAHYMQYHFPIPKEYLWRPGVHGSAWKYCCSLTGASPKAFYEENQGAQKPDYEKELRNPWKNNPHAGMLDRRRREREYQASRDRVAAFEVGDAVTHPKFGEGLVEQVEALEASVRLHIRFGEELKKIDQKWLVRSKYQKRT